MAIIVPNVITRIFIFGTLFAFGVEMATKVSDCRNDIEVKGQFQIFVYFICVCIARKSSSFNTFLVDGVRV